MVEIRFNSGYSPIPKADTEVVGESMTEQSHTKHCDINNIINRFTRTGVLDHVNQREPQYTDVSSCPDYHGALEIVHATEEMFSSLPAELRDRFGNDAGKYLAWINDPANAEEAVELGLLPAEQGGAVKPPASETPQTSAAPAADVQAAETTTSSAADSS